MADLTYERVLELFAETDKRIEKVNRDLSKKIGELGDTLGRFAEEQVKADLVSKFDQWGIPVKFYTTHAVKRDNDGQFAYEVDILIYNTEYVIAIEVKNQLRKDDIDDHIERMKKLQEFPLPDTKGKILLAGIASMIVGEGLDKYAESKGLFFIKPSGDTIKIANNKKTFKPREWKVD
jgi:hypothetical protein